MQPFAMNASLPWDPDGLWVGALLYRARRHSFDKAVDTADLMPHITVALSVVN
jgi:hypothetical protein